MTAAKWGLVDSLFFSIMTMTTGGFLSIEVSANSSWHQLFVALYISVGVPLMTLCMSFLANAITSIGGTQVINERLSANITAKELEMMQSCGIVDSDGYIDKKEYTILILVRIGVLLPDMIANINSVFLSMDRGAIHQMNSTDLAALKTVQGDNYLASLKENIGRMTKFRGSVVV
jgi:hypothetical protein